MKWTWTTPLRERILERLRKTDHDGGIIGPTIRDYCDACRAEDVSMQFWRKNFMDFVAWLYEVKGGIIAGTLLRSASSDWQELAEIVNATQAAFSRMSSWRPPNGDQAFIDPSAIHGPEAE